MTNSTMLLVLIGVGIALGAVLLLSAPSMTPVVAGANDGETSGDAGIRATATRASGLRPTVDAGPDRIAAERETLRLAGRGSDPSGGRVTYHWAAEGGLGFFSDPSLPNPYYTAPSCCDCQPSVHLTLTVTTRSGSAASDSMTITLRESGACPTVCGCTGGAASAVYPEPCDAVREAPCPATPAEACKSPCILHVPPTGTCAEVPVPCRCAPACEAVWDAAWPVPREPLTASERPKPWIVVPSGSHLAEGASIAVIGRISNPACSSVCFSWSATKGEFEDADSLEPTYHAPLSDRRGGESVILTLRIWDGTGRSSFDQVRLWIDNPDYSGPRSFWDP